MAGLYIVLWGKAREAQEKAAAAVLTDEELGNDSSMAPAAANTKYNGETKWWNLILITAYQLADRRRHDGTGPQFWLFALHNLWVGYES